MIAAFRDWFAGLSLREKILVSVLGGLVAIVILWLGLYAPLDRAIHNAEAEHDAAVERHGRISVMVEALQGGGGEIVAIDVPLDLYVSQSAGEVGFTLARNELQGPTRVALSISSARPPALMGWIADLESRGIRVQSLTTQPAGPDIVSAEIVLVRDAP